MGKPKIHFLSFLTFMCLAFLPLGSPAICADTTITLEQRVHFTTAEGSDVILDGGDYVVGAADE